MEIEDGEIVEDGNVVSQIVSDSRKRAAEKSMDDRVVTKRMSMTADNGDTSNDNLNPANSVETAALMERMNKLERMYQRSCRSARESEIRAERAEKIIASMQAERPENGMVSKKEMSVKEEVANAANNDPHIDNSVEMASLKEQVKKLERMFERACRSARDAELRAERAEKIIDTKHGIRDSVEKNKEIEQLQKRLADISDEFEKAKKREETRSREDKRVIEEMKKKLAEAEKPNEWQGGDENNNEALQIRIAELNRLLCESMRRERYSQRVIKDHAKESKEKENMENKLKEKDNKDNKVNEKDAQKEFKQKEAPMDSQVYWPYISVLPSKIAMNMKSKEQQKKLSRQEKKQQQRECIIEKVESCLANVSEKTDDFLAILTPCKIPGKFIDFDSAAIFLKHKFYNVWDRRTPLDESPQLRRECCGKSVLYSTDFISHFCGNRHKNAMVRGGGGVSIAALNQWIEAMEGVKDNDSKRKEAPIAQSVSEPVAGPTAEPAESGGILSWLFGWAQPAKRAGAPTKEIKTEVKEEVVEEEVELEEEEEEMKEEDEGGEGEVMEDQEMEEQMREKDIPLAGGSIKVEGESEKRGEIGRDTTTNNINPDAEKKVHLKSGWRPN